MNQLNQLIVSDFTWLGNPRGQPWRVYHWIPMGYLRFHGDISDYSDQTALRFHIESLGRWGSTMITILMHFDAFCATSQTRFLVKRAGSNTAIIHFFICPGIYHDHPWPSFLHHHIKRGFVQVTATFGLVITSLQLGSAIWGPNHCHPVALTPMKWF